MDKMKVGDIVKTHDDDYEKIAQETACFSVNGHNGKMYEVRPPRIHLAKSARTHV